MEERFNDLYCSQPTEGDWDALTSLLRSSCLSWFTVSDPHGHSNPFSSQVVPLWRFFLHHLTVTGFGAKLSCGQSAKAWFLHVSSLIPGLSYCFEVWLSLETKPTWIGLGNNWLCLVMLMEHQFWSPGLRIGPSTPPDLPALHCRCVKPLCVSGWHQPSASSWWTARSCDKTSIADELGVRTGWAWLYENDYSNF